MSSKGILVVKFPDKLIPENVLKSVLGLKTNCGGFVIPTLIEGKPRLMVDKPDLRENQIDLEMFQERQKTFAKQSMAFWLGELPDGFDADDVQPFGIGDKIAVFADGPFESFAQTESSRPNSFFFVQKYFLPKMTKLFNDCGQDVQKFLTMLQDDQALNIEIDAVAQGDHVVTLVGDNGMYKTFPKGTKTARIGTYDWGWLSDKSVVPVEETKSVVEAPAASKSIFGGFLKSKKAATTDVPGTGPQPDVLDPGHNGGPPLKTDTAIPAALTLPTGMAYMAPPPWLTSNSDVRDWYSRKIKDAGVGKLPENWKDRPAILVRVGNLSDKEKSDLEKQNKRSAGPEQTEVVGKDKATGQNITVTSEHVPDPETDQKYVKQKQINALHAEFVQKRTYVNDPTRAEAEEKNRQTFDDFKLGPLETFMRGADKAKLETLAMTVEAAVVVMQDMRKALGWLGPAKASEAPAVTEPAEPAPQKEPLVRDKDGNVVKTPAAEPQTSGLFGAFTKPKKVA